MYSFCRGVSSVQDEANSLWVWTLIPSVCLVFEYTASIQVFCSLMQSGIFSSLVKECGGNIPGSVDWSWVSRTDNMGKSSTAFGRSAGLLSHGIADWKNPSGNQAVML